MTSHPAYGMENIWYLQVWNAVSSAKGDVPIHALLALPCGSHYYPMRLEQEASGTCFPGENKSSTP